MAWTVMTLESQMYRMKKGKAGTLTSFLGPRNHPEAQQEHGRAVRWAHVWLFTKQSPYWENVGLSIVTCGNQAWQSGHYIVFIIF